MKFRDIYFYAHCANINSILAVFQELQTKLIISKSSVSCKKFLIIVPFPLMGGFDAILGSNPFFAYSRKEYFQKLILLKYQIFSELLLSPVS